MHTLPPAVWSFPQPNFLLWKTPTKAVKEAKFHELIFDTKLTFTSHVQQPKSFCQKALGMLPVEGHTGWGADSIVLLRVHSSLVRSKLDYGCVAYGPAHQSVLKQLDPLHHQGLRIALGAFRTPPAQSGRALNILGFWWSKNVFKLCDKTKACCRKSSLQLHFWIGKCEGLPCKIPPPIIRILSQVDKSQIYLVLIDVNFLEITPCTLLALTVCFNQTSSLFFSLSLFFFFSLSLSLLK